jgi:RNA polymerase sigma factor (sigma-70 family)
MESDEASRRVAAMVVRHGDTLLRTARAVSICADDAQDAVQRALLIYMQRIDRIDPATELSYLKVVVRNEALAVRRGRAAVAGADLDLDTRASDARTLEEHADGAELVGRTAEALSSLREEEARALLAKAAGLSYTEIAERFDWTYTKTNRNITRGRARFFTAFRGIESGERCEAFAASIAALAGGNATSEELVRLRPHLRRCSPCRATVRELHGRARTPRVAAAFVLPLKWLTAARAEAYAVAARVSETASAWPAGGGRTAAATALVGLCLGGAGGICAVSADRHDPPRVVARVAAPTSAGAEPRRSRARARAPVAVAPAARTAPPRSRARTHAVRHPGPRPVALDTKTSAKSEEFGVQPAGRPVAAAAQFEPAPVRKSLQTGKSAHLEFSVPG